MPKSRRLEPPAQRAPVVLLHGFAGAPTAWKPTIDAWPPPRPPVRAVALPGHAPGRPARALRGFEDAADAVAAEALADGGRTHLVGYSLGGRLALSIALRRPEAVAALTLVGAHPGIDAHERAARRNNDERWAERLERDGIEGFIEAWEAQPIFRTQWRLPASIRDAQRQTRRQLDPLELAAAMRQMSLGAMPDYRCSLAALRGPVQLVVGELDEKFRRVTEQMRDALPGARVDVIAGCGHNVPLERPAALAAALADFRGRARPL